MGLLFILNGVLCSYQLAFGALGRLLSSRLTFLLLGGLCLVQDNRGHICLLLPRLGRLLHVLVVGRPHLVGFTCALPKALGHAHGFPISTVGRRRLLAGIDQRGRLLHNLQLLGGCVFLGQRRLILNFTAVVSGRLRCDRAELEIHLFVGVDDLEGSALDVLLLAFKGRVLQDMVRGRLVLRLEAEGVTWVRVELAVG